MNCYFSELSALVSNVTVYRKFAKGPDIYTVSQDLQ